MKPEPHELQPGPPPAGGVANRPSVATTIATYALLSLAGSVSFVLPDSLPDVDVPELLPVRPIRSAPAPPEPDRAADRSEATPPPVLGTGDPGEPHR